MMRAVAAVPPAARWLAVVLLAALALLMLERGFSGAGPGIATPSAPPRQVTLAGLPGSYDEALARLDLHRDASAKRAKSLNDGWLVHDVEARSWLFRARLTGSFDDYAAAEAALQRGWALAAPGTGPHRTGAVLSFGMHRLDAAERYLDAIAGYAVPPAGDELAELTAMRGDIALYRGDYAGALARYDEADRISAGAADFRRAIYLSKTGRPDEAEAFLNRAAAVLVNPSRQTLSFYELHRGILDLDRGRLDEALVHFRRADRIFPGHWLIEEHIAEVATLQGRLDQAERLYRDIVRRTGHPEFIDALAGIADQRGNAAERDRLYAQASALWAKRLKQFPEAAYGHALDHCIAKADWPCALSLARRNQAARPYGDAQIALARALLGSGDLAGAQANIEKVLASSWHTAELHRTAADIYKARGSFPQEQAHLRALERLKSGV
jgi:tetratricopeptide (TPR) repeat protein